MHGYKSPGTEYYLWFSIALPHKPPATEERQDDKEKQCAARSRPRLQKAGGTAGHTWQAPPPTPAGYLSRL